MSEIHQFKCDGCKKKVNSYYNGEHHLPPEGWVQLWDVVMAELLEQHLCVSCAPRRPKEEE